MPEVVRRDVSRLSPDTVGPVRQMGTNKDRCEVERNYSPTLKVKDTLEEFTRQYFECQVQTEP